jgi:hypothetical protein
MLDVEAWLVLGPAASVSAASAAAVVIAEVKSAQSCKLLPRDKTLPAPREPSPASIVPAAAADDVGGVWGCRREGRSPVLWAPWCNW